MLTLGFVSAILPELSLEEVFATASETGHDCVEVMCWPLGKSTRRYAGITHINVDELGESQIDEIHRLQDKYGVTISGLGYYPNALAPDREEADAAAAHIKKVISATAALGLDRMNTFIGRDWNKSVDDNWPKFIETWLPIIQHAEAEGVRVGIENCPMSFTADEWPGGKNLARSPAIWRRMFTDIPSEYFGLNYDPSHLVFQQMDYLKPMRDFSDKLFHIHAKDVRIDRDRLDEVGILAHPNEYHSPKLPGLGEVDWGKFFSTLTDTGYRGPVCVEVEDRAYEGSLDDRKSALRQSAAFLRQFIA
ncbi:Inosose dehydratase [Rubripirellula amarantea]|uniref:Inosose dehydratase n=2 Tax=Rubripirellula amarantea TaxID=2527999 RepID=A0A5C5WGJ3_9BACT|nr:Inosose dehydratase [Rubripirellula amarantea]